jgi:hypothetical protein
MFRRVTEYGRVVSATGQPYRPRAYAWYAGEDVWEGYVVFFPLTTGVVVATPRETTQASYEAVADWATTLDEVYLAGALERALRATAGVLVAESVADVADAESAAAADAITLHRMAMGAGTRAAAEEREAEFHENAAAEARHRANEFAREEVLLEQTADQILEEVAASGRKAHDTATREATTTAADANRRKRSRTSRKKSKK